MNKNHFVTYHTTGSPMNKEKLANHRRAEMMNSMQVQETCLNRVSLQSKLSMSHSSSQSYKIKNCASQFHTNEAYLPSSRMESMSLMSTNSGIYCTTIST